MGLGMNGSPAHQTVGAHFSLEIYLYLAELNDGLAVLGECRSGNVRHPQPTALGAKLARAIVAAYHKVPAWLHLLLLHGV